MSNHTPGEWKIGEIRTGTVPPEGDSTDGIGWDYKGCHIKDENGDILADVKGYTTTQFVNPDVVEANAKIIHAAPRLLFAAKNALSYLNNFKSEWQEGEAALAAELEFAINKATN